MQIDNVGKIKYLEEMKNTFENGRPLVCLLRYIKLAYANKDQITSQSVIRYSSLRSGSSFFTQLHENSYDANYETISHCYKEQRLQFSLDLLDHVHISSQQKSTSF